MLDIIFKDKETVLIGIGNSFRADESAGLYVANGLDTDNITVMSAEYRFEDCIADLILLKPDLLIIVNAVNFKGKPGDIRQFTRDEISTPGLITNQDMPVHESLDVIKEKLPDMEVVLIGIKSAEKEKNKPLTPEVKKAAERIITYFKGREE